MKLSISTGFDSLTDASSLEDVAKVVEKVKKYIPVWHRQDEEDIYWASDVDWEGALFACLMKDGSMRYARIDMDEAGDGSVNRYFDFVDLPEGKEYHEYDIDMWYQLPWKPNLYISGVEMDGKLIQKGPQSADQFKRK